MNHEVAVLHLLGGVAGARRILPPAHNDTTGGPGSASVSGVGATSTEGSSSDGPWLYEGGSLAEILERAADAAGADPSTAAQPQGQQRQPAAQEHAGRQQQEATAAAASPAVLLFHGVCAWAEGQLEGAASPAAAMPAAHSRCPAPRSAAPVPGIRLPAHASGRCLCMSRACHFPPPPPLLQGSCGLGPGGLWGPLFLTCWAC